MNGYPELDDSLDVTIAWILTVGGFPLRKGLEHDAGPRNFPLPLRIPVHADRR